MASRTIVALSVCVFWIVHFVASLFAVAMLVVAPLHPEDFTGLEFMVARALLFPVFEFATGHVPLPILAAINSAIWSATIYGLIVYSRQRKWHIVFARKS